MGRMGEVTRRKSRPTAQKSVAKSIPNFLLKYENLTALLVETLKMRGDRVTPTINLSFRNGRVCGVLNDRSRKRALFTTADGPNEALQQLDAELGEEHPDWREGRPMGQ